MAEAKIRDLLDTGAQIKVISPTATTAITSWSQTGQLEWQPRAYARGDLREAFLVISVTDSRTNAVVFAEAEELHRLCNAVDDPVHCNCYAGAIVRRGALQVAISTAGKSPALAQRLRGELEQAFESEYEPWVDELGEQRSSLLRDRQIDSAARRKILHE
jgi:precorrin-2 dehydrogenase/sirohydrochlorin ferrochelatase